ncbi:hypothetical protein Tco_0690312 [Tanacetum coccineum]
MTELCAGSLTRRLGQIPVLKEGGYDFSADQILALLVTSNWICTLLLSRRVCTERMNTEEVEHSCCRFRDLMLKGKTSLWGTLIAEYGAQWKPQAVTGLKP